MRINTYSRHVKLLLACIFFIFSVSFLSCQAQLLEYDRVAQESKEISNKAFASQLNVIENQNIGCLFDKGVCAPFEQCLDDDLFGTCIAAYADNVYFKYRIPRQLLRELKLIMRSLVEQNYTWHDLFTQCCVRAALVSSSMEMSTDLGVCNEFATEGRHIEQPQLHSGDGLLGHEGKRARVVDSDSRFDGLTLDDDVNRGAGQQKSSALADAIRAVLTEDFETTAQRSGAHEVTQRFAAARSKESAMTGAPVTSSQTVENAPDKRGTHSAAFVDGRYLWIQFSTPELSESLLDKFVSEVNNRAGRRLLEKHFRINPEANEGLFRLVSSASPADVGKLLDNLKFSLTTTGASFGWTRYGFGRQQSRMSASELSSSWSEHSRVTTTLLVCGLVMVMILALFALFIVQRFRSSKKKLRDMTSSTGVCDSSDYKDLWRQRMADKAASVGAGRLGSEPVSASAAQHLASTAAAAKKTTGGSPNSSTGSWRAAGNGTSFGDTRPAASEEAILPIPLTPEHTRTQIPSDDPITTDMDITTGHLILSYMENYLSSKEKLEQEWADLCSYEAEQSSSIAGATPENAAKNRFQDLLPYDHSRVILKRELNATGGDYINASYIYDSDPRVKAYILAQGPTDSTAADFWQMLWECCSVTIVNLASVGANEQSVMYWPAEGSKLFNRFEVHLVSEHVWFEDFLVRNFYLKNLDSGEARTVTMFHFLTWEEAGLPRSAKALLDFRRKVNKSFKGRTSPLVIHCSDGCGRSGTYCLLDLALARIAKGVKEIDLAASLEHLRDQRPGLVKTRDQFEFVVSAIAEEVHNVLKTLPQ